VQERGREECSALIVSRIAKFKPRASRENLVKDRQVSPFEQSGGALASYCYCLK
jgi:hypothetical protein